MKNIFLILSIMLAVTSCKKLVDVKNPIDKITDDLVFLNDATADLAVTGLYNKMMANNSSISSGAMTIYCGMTADELINNNPGTDDEFSENAISASNSAVEQNFWVSAYSHIYHTNAILEGLETSKSLSLQIKNQLTGEARLVRAFIYFNLVNIFGDVPLPLTTDYRENASLPRSSVNLIYEQIVQDINSAAQLLPPAYSANDKLRPTKWTALALLARVHLYRKDWDNAITTASSVINSGAYSLVTNLNAVFVTGSAETIWNLKPAITSISTWEGNRFIPGTGVVPNFKISPVLISVFDTVDLRRSSWMKTTTVGGVNYVYPFKYKVKSGSGVTENYIVLRLAEQYLIRAEAQAQKNNIISSKNDLNVIRQRAGISPSPAATTAELILVIGEERRKELFAEWGHRWLDLKRTDRANAVLSLIKPNWQPADSLFPIPLNQIRKNPSLTQNPGY